MGPKDAPCEYPSPAKASAPAPSAFALPRPRSHFPCIAFHFPRRAIGIPQQQLSTMGYPRKSYPHRCPPPCAKRSRPRVCARVYIIYRSPVGRSRGVSAPLRKRVRAVVAPCPAPPSAGWGRAKAKADAPSRSAEPCRLCAESLCVKAEVHQANPAPAVRSPRVSLSTAAPPPPKWAPRLRRREGKRPNGAPPHRTAHSPNAERKRYLHNSRTKTQRRTKRCAQFVIFVFTPCKLLHNFSTVLHRSPRNVPKRAQIAARRPDFPCFTARFPPLSPESHRAKHPRTAPVLPPEKRPASRLRETAPALSRPRDATTRHDLRILHVFSEIRTRRRRTKCQFLPRRRPKMGAFTVSNVKKRPSNEEKHVFIWTISNLTNTFAP